MFKGIKQGIKEGIKDVIKEKALSTVYEAQLKAVNDQYSTLRDLDLFVLDNSIRESTVGQLRGHTIENKWKIYEEVKKCGFGNYIVASFNHMTRVDDVFIRQLVERGEDVTQLWAFSEITEGIKNKVPDTESVPTGLRKMKDVGLRNVIFEADLSDTIYNFNKFSIDDMCKLLEKWIVWCHDNLHKEARVVINFRDLPDFMDKQSDRLFKTVDFLAKMPADVRLFGIVFEEPRGMSVPEEVGLWAKFIRQIMDNNNWKGKLLVHVHEKFGYCDATALEVLKHGADGIWASVIKEGAAMGNAASCITILNLIRFGNKKVLKRYNCEYLRKAAINVTVLTTGKKPDIKMPIYGERALDFVFDLNPEEFDLAAFFGEEAPCRITTLASPAMICTRLKKLFGEDPQFNEDIATKMKEKMLEDLKSNRKEEYMSECGLAVLFDRAGGQLTEKMSEVIANAEIQSVHAQGLIADVRKQWDEWDKKDAVSGDNMLQFDNFYDGFMAPYFSCYRCHDTLQAIACLDMDSDGFVDWNEFKCYLVWAARQYPNVADADELLDVAFRKGLIPAMQDEMIASKKQDQAAK